MHAGADGVRDDADGVRGYAHDAVPDRAPDGVCDVPYRVPGPRGRYGVFVGSDGVRPDRNGMQYVRHGMPAAGHGLSAAVPNDLHRSGDGHDDLPDTEPDGMFNEPDRLPGGRWEGDSNGVPGGRHGVSAGRSDGMLGRPHNVPERSADRVSVVDRLPGRTDGLSPGHDVLWGRNPRDVLPVLHAEHHGVRAARAHDMPPRAGALPAVAAARLSNCGLGPTSEFRASGAVSLEGLPDPAHLCAATVFSLHHLPAHRSAGRKIAPAACRRRA